LTEGSAPVSLTGAHGTGKTTLVVELERRLKSEGHTVLVSAEVPRRICEEANDPEFFRRGKNSLAKQSLILFGQAVEECSFARQASEICLFDRSVLDHWAYTVDAFGADSGFIECESSFEMFLRAHMKSYDIVFLIRPEFPPIDDGTREADVQFQEAIDRRIVDQLTRWEVPHECLTGTVDQRTRAALKSIKSRPLA
jgi:nicotinamide riboside kinase